MPHNEASSVFTTSGLNQRFKGDKGEAGIEGNQGDKGDTGSNGPASMIINIQTADYTLVYADLNIALVGMNVATANNLTVPPDSEVAFPVGAQIMIAQDGVGLTTIVAGAGVTILSFGSFLNMNGQYAGATLIQKETNIWYLFGNIA